MFFIGRFASSASGRLLGRSYGSLVGAFAGSLVGAFAKLTCWGARKLARWGVRRLTCWGACKLACWLTRKLVYGPSCSVYCRIYSMNWYSYFQEFVFYVPSNSFDELLLLDASLFGHSQAHSLAVSKAYSLS